MDFKEVERFVKPIDDDGKLVQYDSNWFLSWYACYTSTEIEYFLTWGNPEIEFNAYSGSRDFYDDLYTGEEPEDEEYYQVEGLGYSFAMSEELADEIKEYKNTPEDKKRDFLKEFYCKVVCYSYLGGKEGWEECINKAKEENITLKEVLDKYHGLDENDGIPMLKICFDNPECIDIGKLISYCLPDDYRVYIRISKNESNTIENYYEYGELKWSR